MTNRACLPVLIVAALSLLASTNALCGPSPAHTSKGSK